MFALKIKQNFTIIHFLFEDRYTCAVISVHKNQFEAAIHDRRWKFINSISV